VATCTLETLTIVAAPIAESPATAVELDDFDYQAVIAAAEGDSLPAHLAGSLDEIRKRKSVATALVNIDRSAPRLCPGGLFYRVRPDKPHRDRPDRIFPGPSSAWPKRKSAGAASVRHQDDTTGA
jgi:hypothetical protein